ncbi:SipW-dependent-type signal peptide-containing protein [Cellulomonas dongxiuzhuiae]|uniref:SipW-dependent-type signal peptide-containing protein n=1 Tax=Cellulomonas dongxiuzhuiae TaxID=2819979 RepID=A0ABX8GM05_9CELL|nr:SipW-dependent-type signal peptide-containing protein [Cellulomonas dongxiuzhuiae]MBO3088734.1 hypothetical protein [Cellulomonas dongxiuzhuiae]MBO3096292.1 hypothetical protein [Cellulomonas dongxiuzhuiae]QWC16711.1 SipW-dependent-type signal peptide-containing protein [Cellulomonas dongxiuzhuiae]
MTRPAARTRLVVAAVVIAVLLALGAVTSRTTAAWTDTAVFTAPASSGTWGPQESCEILSATSAVLGTCQIVSVTKTNEWSQAAPGTVPRDGGVQMAIALQGSRLSSGRVRLTVDLSRLQGSAHRWSWSSGDVTSWDAVVERWEPPMLTLRTYDVGRTPVAAQFSVRQG